MRLAGSVGWIQSNATIEQHFLQEMEMKMLCFGVNLTPHFGPISYCISSEVRWHMDCSPSWAWWKSTAQGDAKPLQCNRTPEWSQPLRFQGQKGTTIIALQESRITQFRLTSVHVPMGSICSISKVSQSNHSLNRITAAPRTHWWWPWYGVCGGEKVETMLLCLHC